MGWSTRPDDVPCCAQPPGKVEVHERLARLLHTKNIEPDYQPFSRKELFPQKDKPFSNDCGTADGCSVVRSSTYTDNEIRQKCQVQADKRPGRVQQGALIASTQALRSIRFKEAPTEQVVFVYDDPNAQEPMHAVIRGKETTNRADQNYLLDEIRVAFCSKIGP